jgi:hypothetical protein
VVAWVVMDNCEKIGCEEAVNNNNIMFNFGKLLIVGDDSNKVNAREK